jgi:methionine synthase II (cobalamin-independent)
VQRSESHILTTHAGSLPRTPELVIDTTTSYVEHPEVVAERIERAAQAIGDPRRVVAGTDCGFETAAGMADVAEEVVWEKLRALREGADLASRRAPLSEAREPQCVGPITEQR